MKDSSEERPFSKDAFEVEVSAIGPENEGKNAESIQPLPPQDLSRRECVRLLAVGGGALRSRALVLVGAASPTPGINYAPLAPQPQLDTGWCVAGPRYAAGIVFAPSALWGLLASGTLLLGLERHRL